MHAFFGMLLQAPLVYLTKNFDSTFNNSFIGNAFFWLVFCVIGQPMGVIMYYHDLCKYSGPTANWSASGNTIYTTGALGDL